MVTTATAFEIQHQCSEAEQVMYRRYISDGLADTDGWYSPEDFEAWQAHYHRSIGHRAA